MNGKRNRYSSELRERAVRLVLEHRGEYGSQWEAIGSITAKWGCGVEGLRRWVRQAERDPVRREGPTTSERDHVRALERENRELRWANEILRKASACPRRGSSPRPVASGIPTTMRSPRASSHRTLQNRGHRAVRAWRGPEPVEFATLEWVDWLNHRRLLGPIGDRLPAEVEAEYHAQNTGHARAA